MTEAPQQRVASRPWICVAFWTVVSLEWAFVIGLLTVMLMPAWHTATRQAFIEMFCLGPDTTRYAAGYSEAAWVSVREGDTRDSVLARLGEPLDRWPEPTREWWSYSRQRTATDNYLERKVKFDMSGRVIAKHEECYID